MLRSLFAFSIAVFASVAAAEDRMNVLWIVSDDLGPELGCYDYAGVETPNLDRLAASGTRYTRAFSSAPVCSSSRTAFITGVYQTEIGGHHHRTWNMLPLSGGVRPVHKIFRDAGYYVTNGQVKKQQLTGRGKTDYNFVYDAKKTYDGIDWRDRADGQPFFAQIQIKEPHRGFVKATRSRPEAVIPPFYPDHPIVRADWDNYLASIEELDRNVGFVLDRLEADGLAESTLVVFFGDHGRPHVRGKQWLYDGGLHVPLLVRVPGQQPDVFDGQVTLLDVAPTSLAACGLAVPEVMRGADILADGFAGHDVIYAARDRCGNARDRIRCARTERWKYIVNLTPVGMDRAPSYSQVSGYKRLSYPVETLLAVMNEDGTLNGVQAAWFDEARPREELYDLANDPGELNNLAGDRDHAATMAEMRSLFASWQTSTFDHASKPEGDAAFIEKNMAAKRAYYEKGMTRRGLDPDIDNRRYLDWWRQELGVPAERP